MVTKNIEEEKEKKNKRRGFVIAFFIHIGIVILALIPFLTSEPEEEMHEIMIQFANYEPPPPEVEPIPFEDSGSSEPDNPQGDTQESMEQEAAPEATEPEAVPETPDVPEPPAPVETTPEPAPVTAPEATEPKPTTPKPTTPKPTKPTVPTDKPSKPVKPTKPGKGSDANDSNNNGTKPGKPGKPDGSGDAPSAGNNGSGGSDNGTGSGEGSGHGFTRKVKERPSQGEIKAIAQNKTGKVHVDVCINQMGKVVSAKANKGKSTIKDALVLQKAAALAKKYRFEKDFKAPVKQCWYLVFNFREDKPGANNRLIPQAYDQIIFID